MGTTEINAQVVSDAVAYRKEHIITNLETMSLKRCRRLLEEDLQLPVKGLDAYKELVEDAVDKMLSTAKGLASQQQGGLAAGAPSPGGAEPSKKKAKKNKERAVPDLLADAPRTKKVKHGCANTKAAAPAFKPTHKTVAKLKAVCKQASIKIPPTVYKNSKGDDGALLGALHQLLERHGLSLQSTAGDIAAVKIRLEKDRDLEGIDVSNIIADTGRRRAATAAPVNYRAMYDDANTSDDDIEQEQNPSRMLPKAVASSSLSGHAAQEGDPPSSNGTPPPALRQLEAEASGGGAAHDENPASDREPISPPVTKKRRAVIDDDSDGT